MARYDPFEEMDRMFEQLRTRVWTPEGSIGGGFETPASGGDGVRMDLNKHGDEYVFAADLPEFDREEIDLGFEDGVLALTAESERRDERTDEREDGVAVRAEVAESRRVSERVTVPEAIAEDEITAAFRNGVLEVHLPLAEPAAGDDERTIDITD